ncbi:MAG: hypothetical protein ACI8TQ_003015 [Planctomycetota bacterium]|jgi:hypothetical protein
MKSQVALAALGLISLFSITSCGAPAPTKTVADDETPLHVSKSETEAKVADEEKREVEPQAPASPVTLADALNRISDNLTPSPFRVSVGNLSYQDTGVPGDFTNYLRGELSVAIGGIDALQEYSRRDLDSILAEQELSVSDLIDQTDRVDVGMLKGVQGLLTGEYWATADQVRVHLRLLDLESGQVIASQSIDLALRTLPSNVVVAPVQLDRVVNALAKFREGQTKNAFEIKLWTDRGDGAVYNVGDSMRIHFRAEADCYVRIFHLSADDELQMIYPNPHSGSEMVKAGQVNTFGEDDYEFTLEEPLGTELIYAVASTKPFEDVVRAFQPLGGTKDISGVRTRGLKVTGAKGKRAESTCVYTITE